MKTYYAAINRFASSTSVGFANTWSVLAFDSKESRDNYVRNAEDLATKAITKKEIGHYVRAPKPFSGEYRGIDDRALMEEQMTQGILGEVAVWAKDANEKLVKS